MEMENKYASRGVAGTGLGLGIAGTALGLLGTGSLGKLFNGILGGGQNGCNEDHAVSRYELALQQALAAKDSRISLLESNIYVDSKIADVYERLNGKIGAVEAVVNAQAVFNASTTATINCINSQVAQLMGLTKTVIPITSICPEPAVATPTTTTTG